MTRKRRRLYAVVFGLLFLGGAAALVLTALKENIVFFHTPSEVLARATPPTHRFRLGGLVAEDSVKRAGEGAIITFRITDLEASLAVAFHGILPDLFREGQGIVAEGRLDEDGVFQASAVLAKHDEAYMPREVAEALKKSGRWQGAGKEATP